MRDTALITGASSGIGAETAKVFATNGYDLLLLGRNQERLQSTLEACKKINSKIKIEFISQDLNQLDFNLLDSKISILSSLSVLVNNAGAYEMASVQNTTQKIWTDLFQTNLLSAAMLTQHCWKYFEKNKKGSIVNVSSTLGVSPIANTSAYSALKAAMINWTMSLALEGGVFNIRANCVAPGIIDTPIHNFHNLDSNSKKNVENQISTLQLLKQFGKPEDIAEAIYFLSSDKSKFTTGSLLNVDGGINIK